MNTFMINDYESAKDAFYHAYHKHPLSESLVSMRAFFNAFDSDSEHKKNALRFIDTVESTQGENGFIYGMLCNAMEKFLCEFFKVSVG